MQTLSRELRGHIIEPFTHIEVLINDIIRKLLFESEFEYDSYMDILQKGELTMNIKKKLLKLCLNKFSIKKNIDIKELLELIDIVIDKRNILAHWTLDTSDEGQLLFKEKHKLRYVNVDRNFKKTIEYFESESAITINNKTNRLRDLLVDIQNSIYIDLKIS